MDYTNCFTYNEELDELENLESSKFDPLCHVLTFNQFYQNYEWHSEVFIEIEDRLSSLHRQLTYTRVLISEIIEDSKANLKMIKEDSTLCASEHDIYSDILFCDEKYLVQYNYASILSIIYATFEDFLKKISFKISEIKNFKSINEKKSKGPIVEMYLTYIEEECQMNLNISNNLRMKIKAIRIIRNNYIHNIGGDIKDAEKRHIAKVYPNVVCDNSIKLDYQFLIQVFETIGIMCKKIEIACSIALADNIT